MDQRAQISVEYILLVAIVLMIVLVFSLIITNENEQNNVATAAQLGAANASANIVLTNSSQSPIRVTSVSMTNGTTRGSDINVVIHFSRPVGDQGGTIFSSIIITKYYFRILLIFQVHTTSNCYYNYHFMHNYTGNAGLLHA